ISHHLTGVAPYFHRVVLHPAGPGQVLGVLELAAGHDLPRVVEDDAAGAGGALIDREDVRRHGDPFRGAARCRWCRAAMLPPMLAARAQVRKHRGRMCGGVLKYWACRRDRPCVRMRRSAPRPCTTCRGRLWTWWPAPSE